MIKRDRSDKCFFILIFIRNSDAVENISKLYRISDKDKDKETLITSIYLYQTDNSYSVVLDDDVLNTIMAEAKDGQSRKE